MKKYILMFLLAIAGMGVQAQAVTKIGYTNVELILGYMPETKNIESELAKLEEAIQKQLEVKQKYYQQRMMEYMQAKQEGKLTPELDKVAVAELQKLEAEIQKGLELAEQKMMQRRQELLEPLQKRMQAAIDAVAKEQGYTYILNQAIGQGIPSILYGKEAYNVTEIIAKKLGIAVE
jgi:outer membrane protein